MTTGRDETLLAEQIARVSPSPFGQNVDFRTDKHRVGLLADNGLSSDVPPPLSTSKGATAPR